MGLDNCHDFHRFPPLFVLLSPKCLHSFTQPMTYFPFFLFLHNPYLILSPIPSFIVSSYLVILDIKDNPVYLAYLETRILRSTKGVLSRELPARQTPL